MDAWLQHWILPPGCGHATGLYMLVTAVSLLMIATSKGGFGGLAVAASPLMMTVVDAKTALGLLLPMLLVCDVMTLPFYPKEFTWRPVLLLAPWTMIGIIAGWFLLDYARNAVPWLNVGVGVLSVVFAGLETVRWLMVRRSVSSGAGERPWRPGVLVSIPFGLGAGLCTMLAHAAGAVTTIYLLPQRLESRVFVGTTNRFYVVFNAVKIPFYVHLGLITLASLRRSLWLLPIAALGVWGGSELNRRVSQRGFRFLVVVLLLLTGAVLIYRDRGIWATMR